MEQSLMPELIHRYAQPTSLDEAPHGTLCKVHHDKEVDVYAQIGKIEVRWYLLGTFSL
jgi:hypothetical protein